MMFDEIINKFYGRDTKKTYVYLDKDKRWLFCYKKKAIIEHKDCDYYEHNKKCYNHEIDYRKRTHSQSKYAGYSIVGESAPILNECKYCLEAKRKVEKFRLSDDAVEWLNFSNKRGKK